jgi:predicted ATP-dependent protease
MTGEVTLTGQVRPIGGVKEKVLGAKRAGIKKILLPKRNEMDLDDVPKEVRDSMQFSFVEELSEVFMHALGKRIITPVLLGVPDEGRRGNNVVALRPSAKRSRPDARKRRAPVGASSRKRQ